MRPRLWPRDRLEAAFVLKERTVVQRLRVKGGSNDPATQQFLGRPDGQGLRIALWPDGVAHGAGHCHGPASGYRPGREGGFDIGYALTIPVLYGLMGFVFTAIGCSLYHWVAGMVGGIEIKLESESGAA